MCIHAALFTTGREVFDRCDFIHIDGTHERESSFSLSSFVIIPDERCRRFHHEIFNGATRTGGNNDWILKKEGRDRS